MQETIELDLYGGEVKATCSINQAKKDAILARVLQYCKQHNCTHGDTLHQDDNCIVEAPSVLSDIIDDILQFEEVKEE